MSIEESVKDAEFSISRMYQRDLLTSTKWPPYCYVVHDTIRALRSLYPLW